MGRKNRRSKDAERPLSPAFAAQSRQAHADGDWIVRKVSGAAAAKDYRCPGCDQVIPPATAHVVAWPAEDGERGLDHRRHWHTPCWAARDRRGPRMNRGR